jgi:hypothetical protein
LSSGVTIDLRNPLQTVTLGGAVALQFKGVSIVTGGAGNDIIYSRGNDQLSGTFNGGAGSDTFFLQSEKFAGGDGYIVDTVVNPDAGDRIYVNASRDPTADATTLLGNVQPLRYTDRDGIEHIVLQNASADGKLGYFLQANNELFVESVTIKYLYGSDGSIESVTVTATDVLARITDFTNGGAGILLTESSSGGGLPPIGPPDIRRLPFLDYTDPDAIINTLLDRLAPDTPNFQPLDVDRIFATSSGADNFLFQQSDELHGAQYFMA